MANEELQQRAYIKGGELRGEGFGSFEHLNLGATNLKALVSAGLSVTLPTAHEFAPVEYRAPAKPATLKPDSVYVQRRDGQAVPVAVGEHKKANEFSGNTAAKKLLSAQEQALMSALALGVNIAFTTDGAKTVYVDVDASKNSGSLVTHSETRDFSPAVLDGLLAGTVETPKDPTPLAERVWQLIWHATKSEPKDCLLTFVEIFVLKFLSDNLPAAVLPADLNFYRLVGDPSAFKTSTGVTEVEYYVNQIRPKIKTIFPDNTLCDDQSVPALFGMTTVVSKTSVINGFVFFSSGQSTHESYNATFRAVVHAFNEFGPLTRIDPEFKLRLYETFLRRSARQQRLGQFFTPRNVVRPMVSMAQLAKLPDGAIVLDPAAGVGGFLLEPLMWADALEDNLTVVSGKPKRRVKTIGLDVDPDLHILAKANMLLHVAELVRDPATTPNALNKAMAESFVLMDDNKTLGSLLQPPVNSVARILTNPPYVTRGSAIYKDTIKLVQGARNGKNLKDYYENAGLGVEALFMRYISGALEPGGRAFVVVPQGLLNRTEPGPKQQLLDECNLLASIQLPRNTFFNTAQKTYILALEKRHTAADPRPDVLCGLARTIGESLDWRRTPQPDRNDLADIAAAFIAREEGEPDLAANSPVVKVVGADSFTPDDRWDVPRFWTDEELVDLGETTPPVKRGEFIEDTRATLDELIQDLANVEQEIELLTSGDMTEISLADGGPLTVRSGTRITTKEIQDHPPADDDDAVTVYSCFKDASIVKGLVSSAWLADQQKGTRKKGQQQPRFPLESNPSVTVNANGASVGKVFVRPPGCLLTDDVIAVQPVDPTQFDLDYLSVALQSAVTAGGFLYEAKLFATRVRELTIEVPVDDGGQFDVEQQRRIASARKRFDAIVARLAELGRWTAEARII
ncbi:class I SAM-dependent DNA methyltransferase [Kocuria sp. M1N1S27]|uniref:HsdM family class I SAM-dependent methyltransferase n=1 Tax=Kocuria kalidii TaxID=3376283 RepID=UPI0037A1263D